MGTAESFNRKSSSINDERKDMLSELENDLKLGEISHTQKVLIPKLNIQQIGLLQGLTETTAFTKLSTELPKKKHIKNLTQDSANLRTF